MEINSIVIKIAAISSKNNIFAPCALLTWLCTINFYEDDDDNINIVSNVDAHKSQMLHIYI